MREIPNEDAYWERRREEWENRNIFGKYPWDEVEPGYESGTVYLDEEIEEIEAQKGYLMDELTEGDLLEVLEDTKGIIAETAVWRTEFDAIDYTMIVKQEEKESAKYCGIHKK